MKCPDFLDRFSDFYDDETSPEDRGAFREHLDSCPSCRRYLEVVERGSALLRELPPAAPKEDFRARLQHSIYHVEEERRRRRGNSSASGFLAVALVAGALAAVWWVPGFDGGEPAVELSPIVVHEPRSPSSPSFQSVPPSLQQRPAPGSPLESPELWSSSNALLFQHSPLFESDREPGLVRTGFR